MGNPKLGEYWYFNLDGNLLKAKIVTLHFNTNMVVVEYNDGLKKFKSCFWGAEDIGDGLYRLVTPIKLAEKYYPNSKIFRELHPEGREYKGFWRVDL